MYHLLLASKSPRRAEILQQQGYDFQILSSEVSEILDENLSLEEQIKQLAWSKAQAVVERHKNSLKCETLVLSADTVVALDNEVIGKPSTKSEAENTLKRLSGTGHRVLTAFCLWPQDGSDPVVDFDEAHVEFKDLTEEQIHRYIESGDPFDKAGAYGIQTVGDEFVSRVQGDQQTIVGLPIKKIEQIFQEKKWSVSRAK